MPYLIKTFYFCELVSTCKSFVYPLTSIILKRNMASSRDENKGKDLARNVAEELANKDPKANKRYFLI